MSTCKQGAWPKHCGRGVTPTLVLWCLNNHYHYYRTALDSTDPLAVVFLYNMMVRARSDHPSQRDYIANSQLRQFIVGVVPCACTNLNPQKLILKAFFDFSQRIAPPKITHHMVYHYCSPPMM